MENQPLVSVIMPTYNWEKYIKDAVYSVLNQSYSNMEILILDDWSKDTTPDCLKMIKQKSDIKNQIRLILDKTNKWIPENMNLGLRESDWEYIAILDQDDIWLDANKIAKQVEFFEWNQEYGILWTNAIISKHWKEINYQLPDSDKYIRRIILSTCPMLHSSVMYRKSIVTQFGWYSPQYRYAMDYNLFLDFMENSKGTNLSDITTFYRIHPENTSLKYRDKQRQESFKISWHHRHNFPNATSSLVLKMWNQVFSGIFWNSKIGREIKESVKTILQNKHIKRIER